MTGTRQQVAKSGGTMISMSNCTIHRKATNIRRNHWQPLIIQWSHHCSRWTSIRACNYDMKALIHILPLIDEDLTNTVTCSIICMRLNYCNSILYGVSEYNFNHLQRVKNVWAPVMCVAPYRSPVTHLWQSLHWLLISQCFTYKITMLTLGMLYVT